MANVFKGDPDARQSGDEKLPVSRFRPTYRALSDAEKAHHDAIKTTAVELEALIEKLTDRPAHAQRYRALAMTALEEAVMWAIKGLTA